MNDLPAFDHSYALATLYARQLFAEMPVRGTTHSRREPIEGPKRRHRRLINLFFRLLDESGVDRFMEIGCHHAEASARFVEGAPERKALAYEAVPKICRQARNRNAGKPIEFIEQAIGGQSGKTEFLVPAGQTNRQWGTIKGRTDGDWEWEEISVDMVTLREAAETAGLSGGDRRNVAIWMDVEGAQLDIIEGGQDFLRNDVAAIYTEMYDNHVFPGAGSSIQILQRLLALDFIPVARDNQWGKAYNLLAVHRQIHDACIKTIWRFLKSSLDEQQAAQASA